MVQEEFKKNEKTHVTFTIVGIKQLGYVYAPWKKNSKGKGRPEGAKKLFDDAQTYVHGHERVYSSCKVYSFEREGKADKGPRNDGLSSEIAVGQTLHFVLHDYMYEKKSKGENVFLESDSVIEPFSMAEVVVNSTAQENAEKGYGLTIGSVRSLPYTMHSYLNDMNKGLLLSTYDVLREKMVADAAGPCYTIRAVLENNSVGYLAKMAPNSYLVHGQANDMFKLVCDGAPVTTGIQEIDVSKKDLLKFTNAGDNEMYARLLVELAAANDSLYCWVFHNEYYSRMDKDLNEFRGVPLIDTDRLLDFIDVDLESGEDCTKLTLPFEVPNMTSPHLLVYHEPKRVEGEFELSAPDFVLAAANVNLERAYQMYVGCESNPTFMPILFKSTGGAGTKRAAERVNWDFVSRSD